MATISGNWQYFKKITITSAGALSNYPLMFTVNRSVGTDSGFTVYVSTKCQSDYDDIRFTNSAGTILDMWVESSSSATANIWVEVDSIAEGTTTIYLYYSNSSATSISDGTTVFDLFDHFDAASIDTVMWAGDTASTSLSGSICTLATAAKKVYSSSTFGVNYSLRMRARADQLGSTSANQRQWGWGVPATPIVNIFAVDGDYLGKYEYACYVTGWTYGDLGNSYSGTYAIWEIKRNSTTNSQFEINGSNVRTESSQQITGSQPVYFRVVGANSPTILIDWIAVRKFTGSSPTVTWGTESTQPCGVGFGSANMMMV